MWTARETSLFSDDLPQAIEIDVSGLAEVNDRIYARDLALPARCDLGHDYGDQPLVAMNLSCVVCARRRRRGLGPRPRSKSSASGARKRITASFS